MVVESVSGDVELSLEAPADRVQVSTVSGDVRASAPVIQSVNVATVSGDVAMNADPGTGKDHSVTTKSGDLTWSMPKTANATLEASSLSGELEFPAGKSIKTDETLACWGRNDALQATPPLPPSGVYTYSSISAAPSFPPIPAGRKSGQSQHFGVCSNPDPGYTSAAWQGCLSPGGSLDTPMESFRCIHASRLLLEITESLLDKFDMMCVEHIVV